LKNVGPVQDARVFVFKSIIWGTQETKVIDADTGEVLLELVERIEGNLPGIPPVPKNL